MEMLFLVGWSCSALCALSSRRVIARVLMQEHCGCAFHWAPPRRPRPRMSIPWQRIRCVGGHVDVSVDVIGEAGLDLDVDAVLNGHYWLSKLLLVLWLWLACYLGGAGVSILGPCDLGQRSDIAASLPVS